MSSETTGVISWMATIRASMRNDQGRQLFEDRVQSQGFLFLEEYLDDIKASSTQEYAITY
jgi:hypothetical protein